MTGAGRLSSGPQPVMANTAPLFLSCRSIDRWRRRIRPQQQLRQGWKSAA